MEREGRVGREESGKEGRERGKGRERERRRRERRAASSFY